MIRAARFIPRRRALALVFSAGGGVIGILAVIAIVAISAGIGATRTVVLEAQATGLSISFSGRINDWALGPVTVCTPMQRIDLKTERGTGQCDLRRYIEDARTNMRINWTEGASVLVTSPTSGGLVLDVTGQSDIPDRTRIILPPLSWSETGALTFSGSARIGNQLASGETGMILGGSFEVREKPLWSDNTEVLKSGLIRRGESAGVVMKDSSSEKSADIFGHITKGDPGKLGFSVGIVSAPGPVFLQLGFFGSAKPTQVAPNWIDRALTSPLILALAAVLSIVLSAGQVLSNTANVLKDITKEELPVADAEAALSTNETSQDISDAERSNPSSPHSG